MQPGHFPHRADGVPAVVLVNGLGGAELGVVHEILTMSFGTPTVLLEPPGLTAAPVSVELGSGRITLRGGAVRPAVVWARHVDAGTLLAHPAHPEVTEPLGATYWADLLDGLGTAGGTGLPGTRLSRIGHLVDAAALGVRTPRTVVTTEVAAAAAELGGTHVIVKRPDFRIFVSGPDAWPAYLPQVLSQEQAAATPPTAHPVLVQEYLDDGVELRVYELDGGLCAFRVTKDHPASPWTGPGGVDIAAVPCPAEVARTVRRLSAAWGLRFAAYDLLVPARGDPVLLEANPDGDWLWFERRARSSGVSVMAALMVRTLFVQQAARGAPVG